MKCKANIAAAPCRQPAACSRAAEAKLGVMEPGVGLVWLSEHEVLARYGAKAGADKIARAKEWSSGT